MTIVVEIYDRDRERRNLSGFITTGAWFDWLRGRGEADSELTIPNQDLHYFPAWVHRIKFEFAQPQLTFFSNYETWRLLHYGEYVMNKLTFSHEPRVEKYVIEFDNDETAFLFVLTFGGNIIYNGDEQS